MPDLESEDSSARRKQESAKQSATRLKILTPVQMLSRLPI